MIIWILSLAALATLAMSANTDSDADTSDDAPEAGRISTRDALGFALTHHPSALGPGAWRKASELVERAAKEAWKDIAARKLSGPAAIHWRASELLASAGGTNYSSGGMGKGKTVRAGGMVAPSLTDVQECAKHSRIDVRKTGSIFSSHKTIVATNCSPRPQDLDTVAKRVAWLRSRPPDVIVRALGADVFRWRKHAGRPAHTWTSQEKAQALQLVKGLG